jgi:hypothetical protein
MELLEVRARYQSRDMYSGGEGELVILTNYCIYKLFPLHIPENELLYSIKGEELECRGCHNSSIRNTISRPPSHQF